MKKLLLILVCISLYSAKSQNGFTTYTTNLSTTGFVNQSTFLVDNSGNKWIGYNTTGFGANVGLIKYDNTTWTLYNTLSTPALPSNKITALAKDNSGNIWIGTNVGLVKFNGSNFITYNTLNGLPSNTVTCIETNGTQVYVGTNSGLSRFDGTTFTNYNLAGATLPNDTISCIKAETLNTIWLGGRNRMIKFNINTSYTSTTYTNLAIQDDPGIINCIHIDNQNEKWLGTSYVGILKYTGSTFINANSLYSIFGTAIPSRVLDITTGLNNGIVFTHPYYFSMFNSSYCGLTELAPNNSVYRYFYPTFNNILGFYVENVGNKILISKGVSPAQEVYYAFDKTNYIAKLGEINNNNCKTLDINNVKAGIANRGDMHWDLGAGKAMYEVPKGSGKHSNFVSAFWIGGIDAGGQLHGAAQTYRQGGSDYWPGPLDLINASIDTTVATQYDKIWKVSSADINTFITAYNSGSIVATPDMLTWPGNGNINLNQDAQLAPFIDLNGDGIYNPNDGDYPKIKGDQALYFIFNDKLSVHNTGYKPMGIEVQAMAYAYGCPNVVNGKPELMYTTFYDYKIINRSAQQYHDVFVSMFSDVDLGCYQDDYIGSNVADNYGYAYNGDNYDENCGTTGYGSYIPAQGFSILKGPLADTNDGIDNNNNGITDEVGEDCKLNKFNYFNNNVGSFNINTTNPSNSQEYYSYMNGYWRDGSPFTCGNNAYGGTTNTNWVYSGDPNNAGVNTDSNNTCGYWTETSASNIPGDRRMILSSGPFNFAPGQVQEVEYAFVTSFDSSSATNSRLLSVAKLKTDIQKIKAFYNLTNKPSCLQGINIGVTETLSQNDFTLFPNPAKSIIAIKSGIEGNVKINYEVVDVLGKTVLEGENYNTNFTINVSDLKAGIYFLKLTINNSIVVKKFVRE